MSKARSAYKNMIDRCYNTQHPGYHRYGGRGIVVCDRWLGPKGFDNFFEDMGHGDGLTLDRDDNDGPYSPKNCKWSTRVEQSNNVERNYMVTYNGKTQSLSMWARELNMNRQALYGRLKVGWSVERAFTTYAAPFFK